MVPGAGTWMLWPKKFSHFFQAHKPAISVGGGKEGPRQEPPGEPREGGRNRRQQEGMMTTQDSLIFSHGGYKNLKTFQLAQLTYDVTAYFCDRFIGKQSRTHDQMIQAARSGVQNIAEGSLASGTSKKTELKLTNVARASLEELRLDYEDFLRHRALPRYPPNHDALTRFKARRCATLAQLQSWILDEQQRLHGQANQNQKPQTEVLMANGALSLLNVTRHLLGRQLETQAATFQREGGFTERLYRIRQKQRST